MKYVAESEWGTRRYLDVTLLEGQPHRRAGIGAVGKCAWTFGFVLAVCDGEVVEAHRVAGWFRAGETMHYEFSFTTNEERVEFVGNLAEDAVRQRFNDRSVRGIFSGSKPKGRRAAHLAT